LSSTVDVNVLVYASDGSSPYKVAAVELLERLAQGPEILYLFWPVVIGYLRISTHSAIFPRPLSIEAATQNIDQLLTLPHTRTRGEGEDFWRVYRTVTSGIAVKGNLVADAHLASLVREYGVDTLWTHDRDFRKFDGIRIRDPFG
jgi:toxin-antitoxin system PIN domain toxin